MSGSELDRAYDGSTALLRGLRALGWGPLLNLGYYPLPALPLLLAGLAPFQRALARRSLRLLGARPGERVLDLGCGRGWTTAALARRGALATGVDCLPRHVEAARQRYAGVPELSFECADATRLSCRVEPASVDAIHCLEMAFHLEPQARERLIRESYRALRPGGRLVLVDLVWRSENPGEIAAADPDRLVRHSWRFAEFEPRARYRRRLLGAGFEIEREIDWSGPVTARFQQLGNLLVAVGTRRLLRPLLWIVRPQLLPIPSADWEQVARVVRAHDAVRRLSAYVAFVARRPASGACAERAGKEPDVARATTSSRPAP